MKINLALKIDVSKINKQKLFKGEKGVYLDAVAFIDTDKISQFGDCGMIVQQANKEERDAGVRGAILGNAKEINSNQNKVQQSTQAQETPDFDDDVPF